MKYFVIAVDDVKDEKVLEYLNLYAKTIDKTEKPKPIKNKKTVRDFSFTIEGFDAGKNYGQAIPFRDKSVIEEKKREWIDDYENY